jgi:very-short-patch-repair endonuclease
VRVSLGDYPRSSHRHARLRRLFDDYIPAITDSEVEAAFLELCARHGLPIPETQVPIGPYRADFLWRDRAMKAAGFEVLRFAGSEVLREPRKVAREVFAALLRSG